MAIATASGNAVLASLIASLAELEPRPSRVTNRLIKDMTRVAERVIDRDGSGARQAMRRHLQRAARRAD
jgi:DNA-binding GntR family transcriptional regulator